MKTVPCPACQAVNTVDSDAPGEKVCSQCGESLAVVLIQQSIDEVTQLTARMRELTTPRKSFSSYNGFGTTLLDYRQLPDGTFEAVRWIIAIGLPILPLKAYVIEPTSQEFGYGQATSKFSILGEARLSAFRVFRTYMLAILGLLPIVLGFIYSSEINRMFRGLPAFAMMIAAFVWAVYIILFKLKNDSKAYRKQVVEKNAKA